MRRTYSKPYLIVESFQLNAAVATSCSSNGLQTINRTVSDCGSYGGTDYKDIYFASDLTCVEDVYGENDNEQLCYHALEFTKSYLES